MKMGLRTKLLGSFGIVLLLMLVVAIYGINLSGQLNDKVVDLGEVQVDKVDWVMDSKVSVATIRRYELQALVRGMVNDKKGIQEYANRIGEQTKELDETNKKLGSLMQTAEEKKAFEDLIQTLNVFLEKDRQLVQLANDGKYMEGISFYNGESKNAFDAIEDKVRVLDDLIDSSVKNQVALAKSQYSTSRIVSITVTAVAVIIGLIIALFLSTNITKVVNQIVTMFKDMAESGGDLTKRIEVKSSDEIGALALWFNAFMDKLHDVIGQVKQSANLVASAANETSMGNQDLSQRTEEQASSLEEISSTIEEVTASLQQSSASSLGADTNSRSTLEIVHKGETVVNELHNAMAEITKGSHEIAEIIAKVNDIAFQTNLLALNAAVEAARAGEQGRGFAVVAAEVRNLAGRTAESAKDIEGLIKESITKVERGNELMEETATVLSEIVSNTQQTTNVIAEIATSMREQSAASDDIRTAVEQLNQVTQQNASLVEEIAGSSETVSNEAEELSALVGKFKLNEAFDGGVREKQARRPAATGYNGSAGGAKFGKAGKVSGSQQEFNQDEFEKF